MDFVRLTVFLTGVIGVFGGLHVFLWRRVVRDVKWPRPWHRALTALVVALTVYLPAALIVSRQLSRDQAAPLAWAAFVWMGAGFLLVSLLVPAELVRLFVWLRAKVRHQGVVQDPARRVFLARSVAGVATVGAAGLSVAGVRNVTRPVSVKPVRVALKKLPAGFSGLRLVQLTDIHVGSLIGGDFVRQIVDTTNRLNPDVVAITGDLMDGSVEDLGRHMQAFRDLKTRHGVFFVTGNHEYYSGVDAWVEFLPTVGMRVLRNEHVTLDHDGVAIDLAGVDDPTGAQRAGHTHAEDVRRALAGRDPSRACVLLAHQPRSISEAVKHGVDLQLSGHTHGGQIVPFNYAVLLVQPFLTGLHRRGDTQVYVSAGTGFWGPPMRVGTESEITQIDIVAG